MTLHRRVLVYLAVAAIASCALTVGVSIVLIRHRVSEQRLGALENQAELLSVVGGAPGALRAGDHVYRVGTGRPHRALSARANAVLAALPSSGGDAQGTIHVHGQSLLYVARETDAGRVVLFRRAALRFGEWGPFLGALGLAGAGGAVLAGLLSIVLARRLTRPIDALAAATARVASGQPDVTVPVDGNDEIAGLGRSFNAMSTELARARDSQRSFLESVSHELKTPLTSVRGYAEALQDDAIGPEEGGAIIAGEARRLERLVSDLMDLARLGRTGFSVAREPVDLATLAAAAVTRHQVSARELGVGLSRAEGTSGEALGDAERLLQATSNLVENALRLTPPGGSVTVAAAPGELVVSDDGPGLAGEDLDRAFERFYLHDRYRADPERAVGSGLGLAIVAELVASMGGRVRAENRPGGGARFVISLAAVNGPRPGRPGSDSSLASSA